VPSAPTAENSKRTRDPATTPDGPLCRSTASLPSGCQAGSRSVTPPAASTQASTAPVSALTTTISPSVNSVSRASAIFVPSGEKTGSPSRPPTENLRLSPLPTATTPTPPPGWRNASKPPSGDQSGPV
jgi:hypothetical protein